MPFPEDRILTRCRAGDLDAFGTIYAQYEGLIYRYAFHLLGNAEDAQDARQETFIRAYQGLARFRGDSTLQTWLLTICGNVCRDRLKSWQRQKVVLCDPQTVQEQSAGNGVSNDPARMLDQAHTADVIRIALRGLPPSHREVIVLRDVECLEASEVAAILGCSRTVVNVRLFRARQQLKERVMALLKVRD